MKITWTTAMLAVGATLLQAQGAPPRREPPPTPRVATPRPGRAPVPLLAEVAPLAPLPGELPLLGGTIVDLVAPLAPLAPVAPQGTPRPARVDTIRDREDARRLAELAREQAALQREMQLQVQRDQVEWQREQAQVQRELEREMTRQQAELARTLGRQETELARVQAEIARAGALDHARWGMEVHLRESTVHAPAPWAGQDVGDSAYRVARELFNRGEYGQAAAAFKGIPQRFPNSAYVPESQYYLAFSLYRIGGTPELREALAALEAQRTRYPNARSRSEAATLATRIRGVLAARGDAQAAAELARAANEQGATCDKEEQAVQAEAMNALSRSDAANVNDLITRVLARKDECAVPLRRTAVFLVGNRRDAQAVTILGGVARSDPSVDVRVEAIGVIGRLPNEEGVAVLEELARSDDERVQRAAVRALVRHPSARARQSVRALVERDDVSERVRSEALSAFDAERATADDIAWLRALYARFQSPTLKSRALSAIVRVGGPEVDQWLVTIAGNENERSELRATAMRRIGTSMSIADLGKLYDGATQQRFRQEIISVLGKRKEDAATDKLIEIVKNGTDPSLRRSAISALADKNDPRATQLLLEIINK